MSTEDGLPLALCKLAINVNSSRVPVQSASIDDLHDTESCDQFSDLSNLFVVMHDLSSVDPPESMVNNKLSQVF